CIMQRVNDPADPNRCQAVIPTIGQCLNVAVDGKSFCAAHGAGTSMTKSESNQRLNNYRLTKWYGQVSEMTNSSEIKNLRDEVGILRVILQEIINSCHSAPELMAASQQIN